MADPRINTFAPIPRRFEDGSYIVPVEITIDIDGDKVGISDHSGQAIGDACAALHHAAISALGAVEIDEARYTDAFQDKPFDPGKVVRGEVSFNTTKG